jgi:hypothetical protein
MCICACHVLSSAFVCMRVGDLHACVCVCACVHVCVCMCVCVHVSGYELYSEFACVNVCVCVHAFL